MSEEKSFPEFHSWFLSLSNQIHLKRYVEKLAEHQFIHFTVSTDYKTINCSDKNLETGKYEDHTIDVDEHLMKLAVPFVSNPSQKIFRHIDSKDQMDTYLATSRYALASMTKDDFYENFLLYRKSVITIGNKIQEMKNFLQPSKPVKKTSRESNKVALMKEKADTLRDELFYEILDLEDHEDAISFLKSKYSTFKWVDNKKLFKKNGDPNLSQIREALLQVGRIRWKKEYPGDSSIKKSLPKLKEIRDRS